MNVPSWKETWNCNAVCNDLRCVGPNKKWLMFAGVKIRICVWTRNIRRTVETDAQTAPQYGTVAWMCWQTTVTKNGNLLAFVRTWLWYRKKVHEAVFLRDEYSFKVWNSEGQTNVLLAGLLDKILPVNRIILFSSCYPGGQDGSVGISTRYRLDGPGIESRWGGEIFRTRSDRSWGPPSLLYNGYRVFPGGKAAGAWSWSPTPIFSAEVLNRVEL